MIWNAYNGGLVCRCWLWLAVIVVVMVVFVSLRMCQIQTLSIRTPIHIPTHIRAQARIHERTNTSQQTATSQFVKEIEHVVSTRRHCKLNTSSYKSTHHFHVTHSKFLKDSTVYLFFLGFRSVSICKFWRTTFVLCDRLSRSQQSNEHFLGDHSK